MTMTRERIEELKHKAAKTTAGFMLMVWPEELSEVLALAERALEPQGADFQTWFESYNPAGKGLWETMHDAYAFGRASQGTLETQGQALPVAEVIASQRKGVAKIIAYIGDSDALPIGTKLYASQLALPAGPVPEGLVLVPMHLNAEMRDVLSEEDWTWEDLLVAANAVTEEQYYAIQSGDGESPAVAQPVADEREEADIIAIGMDHCISCNTDGFGDWLFNNDGVTGFARAVLARAAPGQPAEEGGKS